MLDNFLNFLGNILSIKHFLGWYEIFFCLAICVGIFFLGHLCCMISFSVVTALQEIFFSILPTPPPPPPQRSNGPPLKTAVNFAVDLVNSTKFPEMEMLGFLEKFITYKWFRGQRLKIYQACHGCFVAAWRSAIKLFGPTS